MPAMRATLFVKLFLMQLLAAAVLVAGAIGVLSLYTGQNFADYLRARDAEIYREVAEEIGRRYAATADLQAAAEGVRALRPPRGKSRDGRPGSRRRERPPGPPPPPAFLLDAAGQPLGAAPSDPQGLERAAIESGGKVVGFIAWPRNGLAQDMDAAFTLRQGRAYLLISCAAILLAALFAALLARRAARPIRELSAASAALARRDFTARVSVTGTDEIGRLAGDFNRLAEALQGYDLRQRQWLADVAHELRNPLAILRAQIDAVLDGVRAPDDQALGTLAGEVARLEAIVAQLHLLSLAESGGLNLQAVDLDLAGLVADAVARYAPRFAAAGFDLRCAVDGGPYVISADQQRIEAVLANLLENALRYATPPGPVTVRVADAGDTLLLAVADGGPGVPVDALPRLFDRLFRVDPSRRAGGGAGLGLAIVRSIVVAHGGFVRAQRSAAGGLEVQCHWPKVRPA